MPPSASVSESAPPPVEKPRRKYTGPPKGSDEAKARMERVRAAQWAKNGLVISSQPPTSDAKQ